MSYKTKIGKNSLKVLTASAVLGVSLIGLSTNGVQATVIELEPPAFTLVKMELLVT